MENNQNTEVIEETVTSTEEVENNTEVVESLDNTICENCDDSSKACVECGAGSVVE